MEEALKGGDREGRVVKVERIKDKEREKEGKTRVMGRKSEDNRVSYVEEPRKR